MNSPKIIKQITGLALVVIFLTGCSGAPTTLVNTSTPVPPTTTSVPPTLTSTPLRTTLTSTPLQPTVTDTAVPPSPTFEPPTPVPMELWSDAWGLDEAIPDKYSCHGENISPPLSWGEPPIGTQSYVLIMDDPDASAVAGFTWDHWLLYNIPADSRSLPEGIPAEDELADGSRQGETSFGTLEYGGPCPPAGRNHGYVFRFFAIDILLDLEPGATKSEIFSAILGHVLSNAIMTWEYPGE